MKPQLLVSLMAFVAFFGGHAYAQSEHPTIGRVTHTKEPTSFWYDCKLKSPTTLECEFTYSTVKKKAKPEDWEKDLAEAELIFTAIRRDWEKADSTKVCADLAKGLEIFTGTFSLPKDAEKRLSEMPEGQKADALKILNASTQLCRNFSKSTLIEVARLQHDKDTRTCVFSSFFDRQTFNRHSANDWVSVQESRGSCSQVVVKRFERAKEAASNIWVFARRKTVINPSEKISGKTCREVSDETEHKFDWHRRDLFLNCDYIEFGL